MTISLSAQALPARPSRTGCRPMRATRCCCWRPGPPATPGRASRSATPGCSPIRRPTGCTVRSRSRTPTAAAAGAARQDAGRLQLDQRPGVCARPGAGFRYLGADGQLRLELRRRPAVLQADGNAMTAATTVSAAARARCASPTRTRRPISGAHQGGRQVGIATTPTTTAPSRTASR